MWPSSSGRDRTTLLTAATLGVYLLVVVGATTSLADAAESCSSWPMCTVEPGSTGAMIVLGHRLLAAVVGITLVITAWQFRSSANRRVKLAIGLALVLYPIQVAVGALLATSATVAPVGAIHLFAGVSIFALLVLGLAWHLEAETGHSDESGSGDERVDSNPSPGRPDASIGTESEQSSHRMDEPSRSAVTSDPGLANTIRRRVGAYFSLMKPRLMWLLCLVAAAAMALAAGPTLTVRTIVFTLGGGVLAIGASGTFNHVFERDRDQKMARTRDRPLVNHEVPVRNALAFGFALTALSTAVFLQLNPLAAALGLTAILFYSVIYTLVLKPNTVQNTVLGGAAGSLPALIGWAAVTGRIGLGGLLLAGFIFVWTPAHFYNLAMAYKEDYARGGFPMMPVVRGDTTTRKHVLFWLGATFVTASALIWATPLGWVTGLVSTVVGALFLWAVVDLHREQTKRAAFRAFHASNAYLGLILVAIVVETLAV